MNEACVIDSSVGFAWIYPNQATPETEDLLEQVTLGAKIIVPVLWFVEVANGLLFLQRRKKLTAEDRRAALGTLLKMNLIVDEEAGKAAFGKASELAEEHGLTVYDATYLELSLRRQLPLATRDRALATGAKKCGIKVI